ncbi:hypothetical protein GGR56DRAFT_637456 [Xylariaceae sp. FL0804]|nr:hypothetical protein GGR56DRAFT_637456 [Xylariaceae sp. FL0804]
MEFTDHAPDASLVASTMLGWHGLELVSCRTTQLLWAGYGTISEVVARAKEPGSEADKAVRKLCRGGSADGTYPLILKLISPRERMTKKNKSKKDDYEDSGEDEEELDDAEEDSDYLLEFEEGHLRKILSYQVEEYFYSDVPGRMYLDDTIPACIADTRDTRGKPGEEVLGGLIAMLLTDQRLHYPIAGGKREIMTKRQATSALLWLAGFHGQSWYLVFDRKDMLLPPLEEAHHREARGDIYVHDGKTESVWLNGGYAYLATRRDEYEALQEAAGDEWNAALCCQASPDSAFSVAELAAMAMAPRGRKSCETLVHGDVKAENMFWTTDGSRVAFIDFQYVGYGLGVSDLAKLFTCSTPLSMLVGDRAPFDLGGRDFFEAAPKLAEEEMGEDRQGEGAAAEIRIPHILPMQGRERFLLQMYHQGSLIPLGEHADVREYPWNLFLLHYNTALVDWLRFQASWGFWGNTEWLQARVRSILKDPEWRKWLVEDSTKHSPWEVEDEYE